MRVRVGDEEGDDAVSDPGSTSIWKRDESDEERKSPAEGKQDSVEKGKDD